MFTLPRRFSHAPARRVAASLVALTATFGVLGTAVPAQATTGAPSRIVAEAARHHGQPYSYGSAGPTRFDCSGLTLYVIGRFGRRLPHNAAQQYQVTRHISRSAKQPGDLLFFPSSNGYIGHVAIYAGNNKMWHAPHSGTVVKLVAIYTNNYVVGRA